MAAGLPGPLTTADRHALALLQLTRVLFLYFIQAKGWLAGNDAVPGRGGGRCLARRRKIHRDLLRPLFFGTLNRPAAERSRGRARVRRHSLPQRRALRAAPARAPPPGRHSQRPLARRLRPAVRALSFHRRRADERGGIAPDMLGRVFEGVMAPDARRASGTYYTPAALVRRLLDAALSPLVADRLGCSRGRGGAAARRARDAARRAVSARSQCSIPPSARARSCSARSSDSRTARPNGRRCAARRRRCSSAISSGWIGARAAVRLTELRLWLAVIADDPARSAGAGAAAAQPRLPHPPGRQPVRSRGLGSRRRATGTRAGARRAAARRIVVATGAAKRAASRELVRTEASDRRGWRCAEAEARRAHRWRSACEGPEQRISSAGDAAWIARALRRLAELRRELRQVRVLRRALARERQVPWFHYRVSSPTCSPPGGSTSCWAILRGSELKRCPRSCVAALRAAIGGGGLAEEATPTDRTSRSPFSSVPSSSPRPGGMVAMLVPAKVATAGYGAVLRHALTASTTLIAVADLTTDPPGQLSRPRCIRLRWWSARRAPLARASGADRRCGRGPTVPQSDSAWRRTLGAAPGAAPGRAGRRCEASIRARFRLVAAISGSRPAPTGCF